MIKRITVLLIGMILTGALLQGCRFMIVAPLGRLATEPRTQLDDIERETDVQIALGVDYDDLYIDGEWLFWDDYLEENGINGIVAETFCVIRGKVWVLVSEKEQEVVKWSIAVIELSSGKVDIMCSKTVNEKALEENVKEKKTVKWEDRKGSGIKGWETAEFSERTSYYYNGRIVLSDYKEVLEYDLRTGDRTEWRFEDYPFPKAAIHAERDASEDAILFRRGTEEKKLTLNRAIDTSSAFKKMKEVADSFHSSSQEERFLYRIVTAEDSVYVLSPISNRSGTIHMMIYQYDFEKNQLLYVKKVYFFEPADSGRCYVVPIIE